MKKRLINLFPLFIILLIGGFFRLYNINWDSGYHLHPDERAITLFAIDLTWPTSLSNFLSPASKLNPHFFAYGSFPLYLLQGGGHLLSFIDQSFSTYDKINLLGRIFSAFFDIGTIVLIFAIARKLWNENVGYVAAFFYAVSVLPIQLSHFFAVDTPLTFFILLTLLLLIRLYEKPTLKTSILIGIFLGFALATKISALVLITAIGMAFCVDLFFLILQGPHRFSLWIPHVPKSLKLILIYGLVIFVVSGITFVTLEPYAVLDSKEFISQNLQQAAMTKDAFTFPYTLQYVGKVPYLYELTNIFLWGLGPLLGLICYGEIIYLTFRMLVNIKEKKWAQICILLTFFWAYFLTVGHFAIGFMRYMLPIYPLLAISGGYFIYTLLNLISNYNAIRSIFLAIIFLILFIWPVCFLQIYTQPNTRVTASEWITTHIPLGDTIAIEHWDDGLPLFGQQNYTVETLELYNPDTTEKWKKIDVQLQRSDYYIIASNRLYTPLQKLTNCSILPPDRCYPQTAAFYTDLFSGRSVFKKVAEFTDFPRIPYTSFAINDQSADESFTVYDHPKVLIFKREK